MNFKEICSEFKKVKYSQLKSEDDVHASIVYESKYDPDYENLAEKIFGFPISVPGDKPLKEDRKLLEKDFGFTVEVKDTIFKDDFDGKTIYAVFIPWDTGEYITLKLCIPI